MYDIDAWLFWYEFKEESDVQMVMRMKRYSKSGHNEPLSEQQLIRGAQDSTAFF